MAELIRNANESRGTMKKALFCSKCENRGTIRVPIPSDAERYSEIFDRLDLPGTLSHDQCRERALNECTCNIFYCPDCEKGLQYKDKYERYEGKY